MGKQADKAVKRETSAATLHKALDRGPGPVKYIRKGKSRAKKTLTRARRRQDKAIVGDAAGPREPLIIQVPTALSLVCEQVRRERRS